MSSLYGRLKAFATNRRSIAYILKFIKIVAWPLVFLAVTIYTAHGFLVIASSGGLKINWGRLVDFARVAVWPAVTSLALLVLRKPLGRLLEGIGQRATKISAFKIDLELAAIQHTRAVVLDSSALKTVNTMTVNDSYVKTLFEEIIKAGPDSDYAVVDLGSGGEWLTSRLFIFAEMLDRMRGVRRFVFLETAGVPRRFLGVAELDRVRWALARKQPWLEAALAKAYAGIFPISIVGQPGAVLDVNLTTKAYIHSLNGRLDENAARSVIQSFIQFIQTNNQPGPGTPPSSITRPYGAPEAPQWFSINNAAPWECARWIDASMIEDCLRDELTKSCFLDSPYMRPGERIEAILKCEGPFVAVVSDGKRFTGLVDRQALLEATARQVDVSVVSAARPS